jgi:hypothetical protein
MSVTGNRQSVLRAWLSASPTLVLLLAIASLAPNVRAQAPASPATAPSSKSEQGSPAPSPVLPRGKKLMLTDGSFALVREYKIEGDRVRYYDLDSSQWEQMPAAMVDWAATKKVEAEETQRDAAIVAKVHKQEAAHQAVPLDIDASLEVAPGIFLPPGDHLFVFDGKAVLPLPQAETDSKLSKSHYLGQILIPIPIVPTRHSISIQGAHAKLRIVGSHPEFYVRVANGRQPDLVLIRAKPHGDSRHVENLDQLFDAAYESRDVVPTQRWDIAAGVFRYTLGQEITPGEYAIAEMVQDNGGSLYVWDFGVDANTAPSASNK